VAGDEAQARFLDAWSHPVQEGQLPDGRVDDLLVDELLHPVEDGFAALPVHLPRLLLEQAVEIGIAAVDVGAPVDHEGLEACGGIAEGSARSLDEILELLLRVAAEEGRPLEGTELHADAHGLQVVGHRLAEIGVGGIAEILAGVEPLGYPASARSCLARAALNTGGGGGQKKSKVLGMMLPLIRECPRVRAWLMEGRSMARLVARRSRRSCQGDLLSHWSGKYTQNVPWITAGLRVRPGVRWKLFGELAAHGVHDVHLAALEGRPAAWPRRRSPGRPAA
jgi:hypothetical protein